jgi:N utilization substance protein A
MKTWIFDHLEITLTEARKKEPDFEIGEEVSKSEVN